MQDASIPPVPPADTCNLLNASFPSSVKVYYNYVPSVLVPRMGINTTGVSLGPGREVRLKKVHLKTPLALIWWQKEREEGERSGLMYRSSSRVSDHKDGQSGNYYVGNFFVLLPACPVFGLWLDILSRWHTTTAAQKVDHLNLGSSKLLFDQMVAVHGPQELKEFYNKPDVPDKLRR
ncbi:hypothetical protein JCM11641_001113 [Rhodosporidiobolus odoratus]